METSDVIAVIAVVVSGLALIASVVIGVRQTRLSAEQAVCKDEDGDFWVYLRDPAVAKDPGREIVVRMKLADFKTGSRPISRYLESCPNIVRPGKR